MASEDSKPTNYFVNGESESTTSHKLTAGQILENAGFTPASEYELEENDHGHKTYTNPSDEVTIHEGQHFTATYTGVTPTS